MATIDRSTERSIQPHYAQASRGARAAAAAAAVLISTSLLGGLLVLFEMQSLDGRPHRSPGRARRQRRQ